MQTTVKRADWENQCPKSMRWKLHNQNYLNSIRRRNRNEWKRIYEKKKLNWILRRMKNVLRIHTGDVPHGGNKFYFYCCVTEWFCFIFFLSVHNIKQWKERIVECSHRIWSRYHGTDSFDAPDFGFRISGPTYRVATGKHREWKVATVDHWPADTQTFWSIFELLWVFWALSYSGGGQRKTHRWLTSIEIEKRFDFFIRRRVLRAKAEIGWEKKAERRIFIWLCATHCCLDESNRIVQHLTFSNLLFHCCRCRYVASVYFHISSLTSFASTNTTYSNYIHLHSHSQLSHPLDGPPSHFVNWNRSTP